MNTLQMLMTFILLQFQRARADCRISDISNIIGGSDYSVTGLTVASIYFDSINLLAIAGQYTMVEDVSN